MPIFVIGNGRAGTHWVGHLLTDHPQVRVTIETRPIFTIATQAAIRPRRRRFLLPLLHSLYAYEVARSRPRRYADKSHPVLWYAERVARWFPSARFVAIERSPYGNISSMLRHGGVMSWQRDWRKFGIPNPFLGIDRTMLETYDGLSPVERAALRWGSHHRQLLRLEPVLGDRLLIVKYEDMIDHFERETDRIWHFLTLPKPGTITRAPQQERRDAWREGLRQKDLAAIERVTGIPASI